MSSHRPFSSNVRKSSNFKKSKFMVKVLSNHEMPSITNSLLNNSRPKTSFRLMKEKSDIFPKRNDHLDLLNLMIKSSPNQYDQKKINKKKIIINPLYIMGTEENLKRPNFNKNTEKVFYKYNLLYGNNSNNLIATYSPKMRPMSSSVRGFNKKMKYENSKNVFVFNDDEIYELIKARCKDIGISLRDNMIYKFTNFINSKSRNRCVELCDFYLGIHSIKLISHFIYTSDRISRLNLTKNNLGDHGIKILINAVKHSMSLISLNITSNNITYRGGQYIFENLSNHQSLLDLNISSVEGTNRNRLTELGVKYIDYFFNNNEFVETLNICGNSIKDEGFTFICKALNDNKSLQNLILSNNEIHSNGFVQGLQYITNCKLTFLNLSNNSLSDSGIKMLSNTLQFFPNLRELNISNCEFEYLGFEYLLKSLTLYKNIWTLNVSGNNLKNKNFENLKPFLEALAIRKLNLSNCSLGNEGALVLGESISRNESLKSINISNNKIRDKGFKSFDTLFRVNTVIESFDCSMNFITDLSATNFVKSIKYNHILKKINLFDNQVSNNIGNIFIEILHSNRTVKSINLLLNKVQIKTVEEINRILKNNAKKERAKYVPDLQKSIKSLKFNPEAFKFYEKNIQNKKLMQSELFKRVREEEKHFSKLKNSENKKIGLKINQKLKIETDIINMQNKIKNILQQINQLEDENFEIEKDLESKIEIEKKLYKKYKDENDLLKIEFNATKKSYDDIINETTLKQQKSEHILNLAKLAVQSKLKEINKKREMFSKLFDPHSLRCIDDNELDLSKIKNKLKQLSSFRKSSINFSMLNNNIITEQNNTGISTTTNENLVTSTSGNVAPVKRESLKKSFLKKSINKK